MAERPLLMIPGPIEVSPAVQAAFQTPPPGHLAPDFIEGFGRAIATMRDVWCADESSQPFVLAGSGTIAMEMAVCNVVEPGDRVLVVNTGYFSDRVSEMLRRRGADVTEVGARPGSAPSNDTVKGMLADGEFSALFATHVDTSTGVRVDAQALARLAREYGALSVFDGVCATAAERFDMGEWGADVYLTASQKAIGLPPGLALLVASRRAMKARDTMEVDPPMSIDFHQWLPVMEAYEAGETSYFSTPATNLVAALDVGLRELLATEFDGASGIEARFRLHDHAARAMRAAWSALGLRLLPDEELAANTLSAVLYPEGIDSSILSAVGDRGVVIAGGLYPGRKGDYFRVGHMGHSVTRRDHLLRTVEAVALALRDAGFDCDPRGALDAFVESFQ